MLSKFPMQRQSGALMIEVLVTILIVTLGLLGIAALFAKSQQMSDEGYQRFQALRIAHQLGEALSVNKVEAANGGASRYVAANVDADYAVPGAPGDAVYAGMLVFKDAIAGTVNGVPDAANKRTLLNAVGCVSFVDAATLASPDYDPNYPRTFYQISVAWQGRQATGAPEPGASACGVGLYGAGAGGESLRRVVSLNVQVF